MQSENRARRIVSVWYSSREIGPSPCSGSGESIRVNGVTLLPKQPLGDGLTGRVIQGIRQGVDRQRRDPSRKVGIDGPTTVRAADAEEKIGYQMPTFTLHGNLVHFAAFKKHIGFYPAPSGIEAFRDELSAYEGAKGSVQFPLDKPIPYGLITKIVKFRVQEDTEKSSARKTRR